MPGELIPFGKYKGQPLVAMAEDRSYCERLCVCVMCGVLCFTRQGGAGESGALAGAGTDGRAVELSTARAALFSKK
jgi:hypothetical protein